jgi:hypothetical protein
MDPAPIMAILRDISKTLPRSGMFIGRVREKRTGVLQGKEYQVPGVKLTA